MKMKRDYYLVFGRKDHDTYFHIVTGDYNTVNEEHRMVVYFIEAKDEDEAYDVAADEFPLELWDTGNVTPTMMIMYDCDALEYRGDTDDYTEED
jgi:hypothetical protein